MLKKETFPFGIQMIELFWQMLNLIDIIGLNRISFMLFTNLRYNFKVITVSTQNLGLKATE